MAASSPAPHPDLIIDLTNAPEIPAGHRLTELVQILTGCSAERAELAVADPLPAEAITAEQALRTTAQALVRLRPRQRALATS
jgi:hypothetical protein